MRKKILYSSILLFIVVIGVVILTRVEVFKRPSQIHQLPDGTVLKLQAVTYGKQHQFKLKEGSLWNRLDFSTEETTQNNSLFFWFSRSSVPSGGGLRSLSYDAVMFDEHGCGFDIRQSGSSRSGNSLTVVHNWKAETFPRRGQTVVLNFYDGNRDELVAEFTAPNPTPGPHPTWTAEPYPITKREGDLAFTLLELYGGMALWAKASFSIAQNGSPTIGWEPVEIIVSDATGNTYTIGIGRHFSYGRDDRISFRGLCPYETAWKLRVEFSRTADSSFSADQLWTVRGVAVPNRDTIIRSSATNRVQVYSPTGEGVTLQLLGIAGAGTVSWSEHSSSSRNEPYVRLRVSPGNNLRPTLQATDDIGWEIIVSSTSYYDTPDGRICDFNLEIPPEMKTLDLTFAVHRSRFAEFIAEPLHP